MRFQEFADSLRLGILAMLPENSPEALLLFSVVLLWVASEVWVLLTSSSFGPTHSQTVPPSEQGGNGWLSRCCPLVSWHSSLFPLPDDRKDYSKESPLATAFLRCSTLLGSCLGPSAGSLCRDLLLDP